MASTHHSTTRLAFAGGAKGETRQQFLPARRSVVLNQLIPKNHFNRSVTWYS